MSSIVYYKRKDGLVFAYSSESRWDPVRKQSRPVRRYLGKVDEVSGEIIPSSGKRGRPLGSKNRVRINSTGEAQEAAHVNNSSNNAPAQIKEIQDLNDQVQTLQTENDMLRKRNAYLETVLMHVKEQISEAVN